jgi:hypothetical protein
MVPSPVGTARRTHSDLTAALWVIVGVLAALLVALGVWTIVDRYTGPEHDATALVDDLTTAWTNGDTGRLGELYRFDATFAGADGSTANGSVDIRTLVPTTKRLGLEVARVGPVAVGDDLYAAFVDYSYRGETGTWLTVLQVENGKIVRHWDLEAGVTPPLTNALSR